MFKLKMTISITIFINYGFRVQKISKRTIIEILIKFFNILIEIFIIILPIYERFLTYKQIESILKFLNIFCLN